MNSKRKCAGCSKVLEKEKLIKLTCRNTDKHLILNPDSKTFGRSVYLCYNKSCIEDALKKNRLNKILKCTLSDEIKKQLINLGENES